MTDESMPIIIFCGICGLIGIIFCIIGIALLRNRKSKEKRCTSTAFGKVTDIVMHRTRDIDSNAYSTSWYPVFEYEVGGLKFVKESHYGSSQSKYAVGQEVEVRYNPEDPHDYYIVEKFIPKTLGTALTILGLLFCMGAIVFAIILL